VLERHVDERAVRLCENVVPGLQPSVDVEVPAALISYLRSDVERPVDLDGLDEPDGEPGSDGGKAIPRGQQAACFVERGRDEPSMNEPGRRLVLRAEGARCLVGAVAL
jgi:hypothetical protein